MQDVRKFAGIGDVERLIAQLGDSDASIRQAAAIELGRLENPKALAPLIAALSDAFAEGRAAAKESLGRLGEYCLWSLVQKPCPYCH